MRECPISLKRKQAKKIYDEGFAGSYFKGISYKKGKKAELKNACLL